MARDGVEFTLHRGKPVRINPYWARSIYSGSPDWYLSIHGYKIIEDVPNLILSRVDTHMPGIAFSEECILPVESIKATQQERVTLHSRHHLVDTNWWATPCSLGLTWCRSRTRVNWWQVFVSHLVASDCQPPGGKWNTWRATPGTGWSVFYCERRPGIGEISCRNRGTQSQYNAMSCVLTAQLGGIGKNMWFMPTLASSTLLDKYAFGLI